LYGQAFAISAVVCFGTKTKFKIKDKFVGYLGPDNVKDDWVKKHVLPELSAMKITHDSYENMLKDFAEFYNKYRGCDIVSDVPVPVESKIFRDMRDQNLIKEYEGPFPLFDVSSMLKAIKFKKLSVDEYIKKNKLKTYFPLSFSNLSTHNPLFDCFSAALAYWDILKNKIV
jgi:hypothetical protein